MPHVTSHREILYAPLHGALRCDIFPIFMAISIRGAHKGGGAHGPVPPPYEMRGPSDGGGPKARLRHCVPAGPKAGRKPVFVISDPLSFESVLFLFFYLFIFFLKWAPWEIKWPKSVEFSSFGYRLGWAPSEMEGPPLRSCPPPPYENPVCATDFYALSCFPQDKA